VNQPEAERRPRQPLLLVALAYVPLQVRAEFHGFDALADPVGWLLIAMACGVLPADVPRRRVIVPVALLATVTSIALWPAAWNDRVLDLDPALLWAISLPGLAWSILFCLAIAYVAHRDLMASLLWKYLAGGFVATAVLPIIVLGGEVHALEGSYAAVSTLAQLALFVLALVHAWRPWAMVPAPAH
jgi:hypothetical protein